MRFDSPRQGTYTLMSSRDLLMLATQGEVKEEGENRNFGSFISGVVWFGLHDMSLFLSLDQ